MNPLLPLYKDIWVVDFEYVAKGGNIPHPVTMVAHEYRSGKIIKLFGENLRELDSPPFNIGKDALFVAYYSPAEFSCFLPLGWPMPENVLDLYVEFRNLTNGTDLPAGRGLLGALTYYGLSSISKEEKHSMRDLVLRGEPYSDEEKTLIEDYCETDVISTTKLFERIQNLIDLDRALVRGEYLKTVAIMEHTGVPIDVDLLSQIKLKIEDIKLDLIKHVDPTGEIYEEAIFKIDKFKKYLPANGIYNWPLTETGLLCLTDDTFKAMSSIYPFIGSLHELRKFLSTTRKNNLQVGSDRRNRTMLSPFQSKTGRNQPSNSKSIYGLSAVWRFLIKPEVGMALAYIDWSQQEFGIVAALSKDEAMMEAYSSGDPYLAFAKQAGAVPVSATKSSHPQEREQFKACALAVQYSMGAESLANRINKSVIEAKALLRLHRQTYYKYWKWSDSIADQAMLVGVVSTVFGWNYFTNKDYNERSFRNFPAQANGAEMLRLACCLGISQGVKICIPVHDAILIEASVEEIEERVSVMQACMEEASSIVLGGFKLRSDAKVIKYPDRYTDERGQELWNVLLDLLREKGAQI